MDADRMFDGLKNKWMKPRYDVAPCPKCGNTRTVVSGSFKPLGFFVKCPKCEFGGQIYQDKAVAILSWNNIEREEQDATSMSESEHVGDNNGN